MMNIAWSLQRSHHGEQPYWALVTVAAMLGTDPVSMLVLAGLCAICAVFMKKLTDKSWFAITSFPILMAGALLADDAAVALGLYPSLAVSELSNLDLVANWKAIEATLPNVLSAGVLGMIVSGGILLLGARCLSN